MQISKEKNIKRACHQQQNPLYNKLNNSIQMKIDYKFRFKIKKKNISLHTRKHISSFKGLHSA